MNLSKNPSSATEGMTGKEAEKKFLGACPSGCNLEREFDKVFSEVDRADPRATREFLHKLRKEHPKGRSEYQLIEAYFRACIEADPRYGPWMRGILTQLSEDVGDRFDIHFISALGSSYDILYGIDGMFLFVDKNNSQNRFYVTIDFTLNPEKEFKDADLIVGAEATDEPKKVAKSVERALEMKLERAPVRHTIRATVAQESTLVESPIQVGHEGGILSLIKRA